MARKSPEIGSIRRGAEHHPFTVPFGCWPRCSMFRLAIVLSRILASSAEFMD